MAGSDNDSDSDLLDLLLGNEEPSENAAPEPSKSLKDLDFNFLDEKSNAQEMPPDVSTKKSRKKDSPGKLIDHSSDEEDKDYFDRKCYSEFGRDIKDMLNTKTNDERQQIFTEPLRSRSNTSFVKAKKLNVSPASSPKVESKGIYNDPVFGLGMTKPLVSSTELLERMQGRKAVTISSLKDHISTGNTKEDWVVAGVIISKSSSLVSQKGSQYCIWKLSDLGQEVKAASLFLFSNSYKTFWKTSVGTIVGVLNPNILESRDKDQASLSIDNPSKIMILGTSRDMGKCKAMKKNGDPCNAIVNIRTCEYCVYHVKQEYKKFSRRPELQSNAQGSRAMGFGVEKKSAKTTQNKAVNGMGQFLTIKSKRNEANVMKERTFLEQLNSGGSNSSVIKPELETAKPKASLVELTPNQMKKDLERLAKLKACNSPNQRFVELPTKATNEKKNFSLATLSASPRLGFGITNGFVDLSIPIPKKQVETAKKNALEWIRKNGTIKATNPNQIHPNKDKMEESKTRKRRPEEEVEQVKENAGKKVHLSNEFKKLLETQSAHTELIEQSQNEEQEKYFDKLEIKEKMEEKMLSTFQVKCKAVRCSICKYVAFSASDLCKEQRHPIRVFDAVKRFYKCGDCGNRTVCLDRIPARSCSKCNSSSWVKTGMMDERRTQVKTSTLSIRGDEEKFCGSVINNASLNLIVPD